MPNGNGTGPSGMGPMTGRGMGVCSGNNAYKGFGGAMRGQGRGMRRGFGRQFEPFQRGYYGMTRRISDEEYKEILTDEVDYLEKRLKTLKEELDTPPNNPE